jgi:hypothetical protein
MVFMSRRLYNKAPMTPEKSVQRIWYKATLTPMAQGLFTDAFYPDPKRGSGAQYVFFTQEDVTPAQRKIIVASKMAESGLRMMTLQLAQMCLAPTQQKATRAEMTRLNELGQHLKI